MGAGPSSGGAATGRRRRRGRAQKRRVRGVGGVSKRGAQGSALSFTTVRLRDLPSVDELARAVGDPLAVDAARAVIDRAREEIRAGGDPGDLGERVRAELASARAPRLRRVLNATGVIVHTNLGRAPLAE